MLVKKSLLNIIKKNNILIIFHYIHIKIKKITFIYIQNQKNILEKIKIKQSLN